MFYERSLSKSEIARQMKLSVTHVNRLLREGARAGVVEIRVKPHTVHSLESELIKVFRLREARVVASSADVESTGVDLGRAAAVLFDELAGDGRAIGVGSGRTLFEMASRLPEHPRRISIYPANLILEQDLRITGVTANAVATIAWFRSRPSAKAWRLEMFFPSASSRTLVDYANGLSRTSTVEGLRKRICALDVYFLGASDFRKDSQLARLRTQMVGGSISSDVIGDIAFNVLDTSGRELDIGLGQMVLRIPAECLTRIVKTDKTVVLAAGGLRKVDVIAAALAAGLCNILITDSDTAEKLLKNSKTSVSPTPSNFKEVANGKRSSKKETNLPFSLLNAVQN